MSTMKEPEQRGPEQRALAALALALVLACTTNASADPWKHPALAGYGRVAAVPNAALPPAKGVHYKLALEVTTAAESTQKVNPGLEKVARTLNVFAEGGVAPRQIDLAVVVHGDATPAVLRNAIYAKQHGGAHNPNLALLRALHAHGVEVYVCGQALAHRDLSPSEVAAPVKTALAATVALAELQRRGYALLKL